MNIEREHPMLDCQKHLFQIPEGVTYLNAAFMGPALESSTARGVAAVAQKQAPWEMSPADFFPLPERSRSLFGRLIGSAAENVAIVPSASYGVAVAARNIPAGPGQSIVVLAEQFPSNVYPWRRLARRTGAALTTVARPGDDDWTRALLAAIDETTAVVACGHCHWTDGGLIDLVRVGRRCREVGAALVVDGTQSVGVMPFSVADIRPDFLIVGAYKWLLGPYSYGWMYVDPKWHEGEPLEETWLGRNGCEDFAGLANYRDDYQPGALRFDMGERSNFALTPIAVDALETLLRWGTGAISDYLGMLTDRIATGARRLGLGVPEPSLRAPHMIGLRFDGPVPADLPARFARENIFVSVRGGSIRVAPHMYNDAADVDRFLAVLERELATGRGADSLAA
jgi:selenocysteine lyase/cysteine desulfurase